MDPLIADLASRLRVGAAVLHTGKGFSGGPYLLLSVKEFKF